jgi:hypothetical protein
MMTLFITLLLALNITAAASPAQEPGKSKIAPENPATTAPQQTGALRNENIQINLIDNNALNERLGRDGVQAQPFAEATAVRSDYMAPLGGLGPNININTAEHKNEYHGDFYEMLQNSVFNARTFFQVGSVQPSRRNDYGFSFGGPLLSKRWSFLITGLEVRQSGYINGNVLVPLPEERTPRTTDPKLYAVIQRWLEAYPKELPNRTEIDPRMLNTNAYQKQRTSGGTFQVDWNSANGRRKAVARYSIQDTFIDAFQLWAGQNPDQRLRPQTLNLSFTQDVSDRTTLRFGTNYQRNKIFLLIPPGAVGPMAYMSGQIADLGPKEQFPIRRIRNDFEYLFHATRHSDRQDVDWGGEVRRYQMNDIESDDVRGTFGFNPNFGRSAVENFLLGIPTLYRVSLGDPYRGFRNTDWNFFVNDRIKVTPDFQLSLGLRYELAGAPNEVNNLAHIPYNSDRNNFAPRVGLAYKWKKETIRAAYGVSFGRIFPASFQWGRFNQPEILRIQLQNIDFLDPLKTYNPAPETTPRSTKYVLDPNFVVPYTHQYSLQIERELSASVQLKASYIGSRTWKLAQMIYGNRAVPIAGIPLTTATIDTRRPDQRYYNVNTITSMGRSYFDAAQVAVERRGRDLTLNATYTFAKAIDTGTDFASTVVNLDELKSQNEFGVVEDMRGLSKFDAPHRLSVTYSYALPTRWLRSWTVIGTTLLHSGTPFLIQTGGDAPGAGNVDGEYGDRPSIVDPSVRAQSVDNPDTSPSILRRDAFVADGTIKGRGNLGRNVFRKDGVANFNLALQRTFAFLSDRSGAIIFRAEAVNLTNHAQFDAPNPYFTAASFGRITNTLNAGRVFQFALSMKF